ncbi:hypothetical protein OPV22_005731 [Ensete ventricosum]|uniref:Uncharacterized protein n=1 Tax=Ensete ventricosum TaxID=4639 RepID=A0AAV8RPV3_ENSVE|nr:hypothetical protein OPV22_005731 [Ensete ventricosum]RWW18441.1 hypothetical protein GW17_00017573 [Ensete ventricosum]RWW71322.1 hypothetical protein BHE74_00020948 [Ensete ventricosum]RZS20770.1 hypothetical protein BHM03_00053326 [Ensete ventricosum]
MTATRRPPAWLHVSGSRNRGHANAVTVSAGRGGRGCVTGSRSRPADGRCSTRLSRRTRAAPSPGDDRGDVTSSKPIAILISVCHVALRPSIV